MLLLINFYQAAITKLNIAIKLHYSVNGIQNL